MPNEVNGICTQEDAGRALYNEREILEMIPLHTCLKGGRSR